MARTRFVWRLTLLPSASSGDLASADSKFVPRLTLLLALFVVGALSFWVVGRVKVRLAEFSRITLQKVVLAGQINSYQAEGYACTLQLLRADTSSRRSAYREAMYEYRDKTAVALENYRQVTSDDESLRLYQELVNKRAAYHRIREEILALHDEGRTAESAQLLETALQPAYRQYTKAGDALLEHDVSLASLTSQSILRFCTIAQFAAAVISIIGFVGGVSLPFVMMWLRTAYRDDPLRP